MEIIEILKFNRELLNRMHDVGIRLDDYQYVDLYNEYQAMRKRGEKVTYIVAILSDKYDISERKVYDLVKRLNSHCKMDAVP